MSPHSFVLADSFDAMPDHLYDTVEAFTAASLEPEYMDFDTCLHCNDSRLLEALNQYYQDVLAPCPHCTSVDSLGRRLKAARARLNHRAILLYRYSKMSDEQMTIWHRKHLDSLLNAA